MPVYGWCLSRVKINMIKNKTEPYSNLLLPASIIFTAITGVLLFHYSYAESYELSSRPALVTVISSLFTGLLAGISGFLLAAVISETIILSRNLFLEHLFTALDNIPVLLITVAVILFVPGNRLSIYTLVIIISVSLMPGILLSAMRNMKKLHDSTFNSLRILGLSKIQRLSIVVKLTIKSMISICFNTAAKSCGIVMVFALLLPENSELHSIASRIFQGLINEHSFRFSEFILLGSIILTFKLYSVYFNKQFNNQVGSYETEIY
jgi:hypothetical protein